MSYRQHDIRSPLNATKQSAIICELSEELNGVLQPSEGLSVGLVSLLAASEVIYESAWGAAVMVFRISDATVVKVKRNEESVITEHRSLSFLEQHLPGFPAPKPHGVVRLGSFYLLFTSFVSGFTLEQVWSKLMRWKSTPSALNSIHSFAG